jgi:arginase family enzyme
MSAQRYISFAFESSERPIPLQPHLLRGRLACRPKAIGPDVCEIAPAFDGDQTAALGAKLIREFIAAKEAAKR